MRRIAWFHAFSGIAGDMALGSCIDAGADLDEVRLLLQRLPIDGWSLEAEPVLRGGIAATYMHVNVRDDGVARTAEHIRAMVEEARLPDRVRDRALHTFRRLAETEGHLHRRPPNQVHFHEVGGHDAILDVVGTCAALEVLDIDEVAGGPVATGVGMVRAAHGMLPVPTPAVVELLRGVPVTRVDINHELTTPTGAALLTAMATGYGPLPAMTIRASGYGAGKREFDHRPNVTQLVVGDTVDEQPGVDAGQPAVELQVNVDDATGEQLAHTIGRLLDAGALDAWLTPVIMKKGRPGHVVTALADVALAGQVAAVLVAESGSFGVRGRSLDRWPAARIMERVIVDGQPIRVKVSPGRTKVEHDDAAAAAVALDRPLREVVSLAEEAARRHVHETAEVVADDGPDDDPPQSA